MFNVTYRKTHRDTFKKLGISNNSQWYTSIDAAMYADALAQVCIYASVTDADTGRTVYDATTGEWLDTKAS